MPSRSPITRLALALVLALTVAGCDALAFDPSNPTPASSTTHPLVSDETSLAPSSTSTAPSTSTPDASSTTTSTSTTTTTTTLAPLEPPTFDSIAGINRIREFSGLTSRGLSRWERSVPGIEDMRITSTADGAEQPALWLPPSSDTDAPLVLILHSWSSNYVQHAGIPYAMWAQENGWAVIAPDFRGRNDDADAIGSELAVQDVVDAIDFATAQDGVDVNRVYAVGYSGGGMMALLMAGRHPDKVTAVAAWGAPYDLLDFYVESRRAGRRYAPDLRRGCGGDPSSDEAAEEECLRRSPMTYLDAARESGVPVFIGQGIWDSLLAPSQGARAFNQLADPEDRLSDEQVEVFGRHRIPDDISEPIGTETFFGDGDPAPVFARHSANVWLVFFRADHEMVYLATMRWFATDPR